jgi:AIPR protein.
MLKKAYAFTCNALEFLKILKKEDGSLRRSLFNDNVRDYLGDNKTVNSEIENTITESPEMFLLCNNGITIVCTDFEQIRDKLVKIENPQIVKRLSNQ